MGPLEGLALLLISKEGANRLLGLRGQLQIPQLIQQANRIHPGVPLAIQGGEGQSRALRHHQLRVLRNQNVLGGKPQPLGKHPNQGWIEGEGTALKGHRLFNLQTLGQAADGLFGDGVEGGQSQVLL